MFCLCGVLRGNKIEYPSNYMYIWIYIVYNIFSEKKHNWKQIDIFCILLKADFIIKLHNLV